MDFIDTSIRKSKKNGRQRTLITGLQLPPQQKTTFFDAPILIEDSTLKDCKKLLTILSRHIPAKEEFLVRLKTALKSHEANLERIIKLFNFPPYPDSESFLKELESPTDIKIYLSQFEKDPKGGRRDHVDKLGFIKKLAQQKIQEQFSTLQIESTIKEIQDLLGGDFLSIQDRYDLAQQITYINAVGKDYPLIIELESQIRYDNLTQCSREELNQLSNLLIDTIRLFEPSETAILKNQLKLLAVLREQYFRATGVVPTIRQLATVLISLKNQPYNMLMEINTDQDQGVTAALLAVMQWVVVDGGTVDVCTANRDFVERDYHKNGVKDFFSLVSAKINSSVISVDSPKGTYQVGGINYSTLGDLALYRSRAAMERESLGSEYTTSLLIDRYDLSALKNKTVFQSIKINEEHTDIENPYARVYPLVDEFINCKEFKNVDSISGWTEEEDVQQLKVFLNEKIPGDHPVHHVSDEQLNEWIESALRAEQLVEGVDFYIPESSTSAHVAVPLHQKEPQIGITFSKGVQQFLHARLEKSYQEKGWTFLLEQETPIFDSVAVLHLINKYQKGRTIGLCATLDRQEDIIEQCNYFNMRIICRMLPPLEHPPMGLKPQNEEKAIEHHYTQTVFEMQQVILKQFDEWQAFLHLVSPLSERAQLNKDLLTQRGNLLIGLEAAWQACLDKSNENNIYPNPFVRPDANGKLETKELEEALSAYEVAINDLWSGQCAALKAHAETKIEKGSVNELRCNYIAAISILDQLQLDKLQRRKNQQMAKKQIKKDSRRLISAFDVNAAMLQYSDGMLEEYQNKFEQAQVELFKTELLIVVKSNLLLSRSIKKELLHYIKTAQNWGLYDVVLFLNNYAKTWLPKNQFNKKYAIQFLVQEVLYACQQLKSPQSVDQKGLIELKALYLDNVMVELVDELRTMLSWAVKGNRGLGYLLERSAVVRAANDILLTLEDFKNNPDLNANKVAIKKLYQVLMLHQANLKDLWIFSFGHKNTRTLIKNTLATLDKLTVLGYPELGVDFLHECKENALYHVMNEQFNSQLKKVNAKIIKMKLKKADVVSAWEIIKEKMILAQKEFHSIHGFHEMRYFLNEVRVTHPELLAPIIELRGHIRNIWLEFQQKMPAFMDEDKYFVFKAEKMKLIFGESATNIQIKAGDNGFSQYYDLVIETKDFHPLLNDFTQHHSQLMTELKKEYSALETFANQIKSLKQKLKELEGKKLPVMTESSYKEVDPLQFPELFHAQIKEINALKNYINGQPPEDITVFTKTTQDAFKDRALVQEFVFPDFTIEQISKINDQGLHNGFLALYETLEKANKVAGILEITYSFIKSVIPIWKQETINDWEAPFIELTKRPQKQIEEALNPTIDNRISNFSGQLEEQETLLADKMSFLSQKIKDEEVKNRVYIKRFKNITELYDFEIIASTAMPNENLLSFDDSLPSFSGDEQLNPFML